MEEDYFKNSQLNKTKIMDTIDRIKETINELKNQAMANYKAIERLEKKLKDLETISKKQ